MLLKLMKIKKNNDLLQEQVYKLNKLNSINESTIQNLSNELKTLKRKNNSSKGGYISKINKLELKIKELENQLKESMTDKYLVKKIPSGRPPKQNTMKVKNCTKTSMISKKMHNQK